MCLVAYDTYRYDPPGGVKNPRNKKAKGQNHYCVQGTYAGRQAQVMLCTRSCERGRISSVIEPDNANTSTLVNPTQLGSHASYELCVRLCLAALKLLYYFLPMYSG